MLTVEEEEIKKCSLCGFIATTPLWLPCDKCEHDGNHPDITRVIYGCDIYTCVECKGENACVGAPYKFVCPECGEEQY